MNYSLQCRIVHPSGRLGEDCLETRLTLKVDLDEEAIEKGEYTETTHSVVNGLLVTITSLRVKSPCEVVDIEENPYTDSFFTLNERVENNNRYVDIRFVDWDVKLKMGLPKPILQE